MSLVEKALRKLQAGAKEAGAPATGPVAPVELAVERVEPRRTLPAKPRTGRARLGGAPPIEINVAALRTKAILPPESEERELADQYRTIKRPLLKSAFQQPPTADSHEAASPRSIMITSALPGDGKTFTAFNLALSMSRERDYSVLLVDADVAKRDVTGILGMGAAPGLLDVLTDQSRDIGSVIAPTNFPGFSVMPAGTYTEAATELLASARMHDVLASLIELDPNCVIVFDSPPILLTTEAPILAALFGQIVMVVRANQTPQPAVQEAIRIVGANDKISLVLNGADVVGPAGYHYGGYGYGFGYYRSGPEAENADD